MARMSGYRCDCPGCTTFEVSNEFPVKWLRVTAAGHDFELCGNKCLKRLAEERIRADRELSEAGGSEPRPKAEATRERGHNVQEASLVRWHREGKHGDEPRPDCPLCEIETDPLRLVIGG